LPAEETGALGSRFFWGDELAMKRARTVVAIVIHPALGLRLQGQAIPILRRAATEMAR
jgi:hypothetical protein